MKNDYLLRLEFDENDGCVLNFRCTRSQVDKVFFALAFASAGSNIRAGSLSLKHPAKSGISLMCRYEKLNEFKVGSGNV